MQQALAAAKEAAHRAGEVILSYYSSHYEVQSKGVDNPVTTADLAANRVLHETLLAAFPEAGWLSEESVDDVARLQTTFGSSIPLMAPESLSRALTSSWWWWHSWCSNRSRWP